MVKVVTVEEMRAIEQAADAAGHSYSDMMQLAGRALADLTLQVIQEKALDPLIVVLVGPGNNGGDGLVAARYLAEDIEEAQVVAYLLKNRDDAVFHAAQKAGVATISAEQDDDFQELENWLGDASVVLDALFGTGTRLPIKGTAAKLLKHVHKTLTDRQAYRTSVTNPTRPVAIIDRPYVLAVDCPSGLDCDTGALDPLTLHADATVTFAAAKPGLLAFPGAEAVGQLHIGDIGLPEKLKPYDTVKISLADGNTIQSMLPKRGRGGHKGTYGKAMIVAGSANYIGAAYLAGSAAYRSGAGLVTVAAPHGIVPTLAAMLPEATWLLLPHEMGAINERAIEVVRKELDNYSALLVGPGWGQDEVTHKFLHGLLTPLPSVKAKPQMGFQVHTETTETEADATTLNLPPLVIDADGLNLLAQMDKWWQLLPKNTILTPHPGEFARLAGLDTIQTVQADRLNLALKYAKKWKCIVVLKGAFTIVAQPNGQATVIPFATSALATAGTGDVLAGAIVGLLAQGVDASVAAIVGAWLHGFAGTQAEAALGTPTSVMAGDVLRHLSTALSITEQH